MTIEEAISKLTRDVENLRSVVDGLAAKVAHLTGPRPEVNYELLTPILIERIRELAARPRL